jgi:hypothetical protein
LERGVPLLICRSKIHRYECVLRACCWRRCRRVARGVPTSINKSFADNPRSAAIPRISMWLQHCLPLWTSSWHLTRSPVARRGTPPPQDSHVTKLSILTRFVTHVRSRSKRSVLRLRSNAHDVGSVPARHPMHHYCSARAFAVNPSRPSGATLRALGVDCSARPSKEGLHAMNAERRRALKKPQKTLDLRGLI